MLRDTSSTNTEELKLPGTLNGDDRMNRLLDRYVEKDKSLDKISQNMSVYEDPFKTRDKDFMAYKYHHKYSRNNDMSHKSYDGLPFGSLSHSYHDKNVDDYNSKVREKISDQLETYNPFVGPNSRDKRLKNFQAKSYLNTISNPNVKRYHREMSNSYKNLKATEKNKLETLQQNKRSEANEKAIMKDNYKSLDKEVNKSYSQMEAITKPEGKVKFVNCNV